jgi:hypothetical protein
MVLSIKKLWSVIKSYWKLPLAIVVGIIGLLTLKGKDNKAKKILDAANKTYEKEKEIIQEAQNQKIVAKEKVEKEYDDAVRSIETVYKFQKKTLDEQKKKEIKKIVKKHYNNKEELGSEISNLFGITYAPRKDNNNTD